MPLIQNLEKVLQEYDRGLRPLVKTAVQFTPKHKKILIDLIDGQIRRIEDIKWLRDELNKEQYQEIERLKRIKYRLIIE